MVDLLQYLIMPGDPRRAHPLQPSAVSSSSSLTDPSVPQLPVEQGTMEVETTHAAPPHTNTSDNNDHGGLVTDTDPKGTLDQVLSIEDYMALHRGSSASGPASPHPVPVALGARSSKNTILLHQKAQALGLELPKLVFDGDTIAGWSVTAQVCGETLNEPGPYHSKREAKEAVAKRAYELVCQLEADGVVSAARKKKRVSNGASPAEKAAGPNYIGMLHEFRLSTASPQPEYNDYGVGTQFSCVLTLDDVPTPFGSQTARFPNKKAARQNAAKDAVEYFQHQGLWPEDESTGGGIRKKKKKKAAQPPPPPPPLPPPGRTSISATQAGLDASAADAADGGESSFAFRVAQLANALSLPTPEYRLTPEEPKAAAFYTGACYFKNAGAHVGPHGEVRHVHGKKKAKEECARLTLGYLMQVKEQRISYGRKMMADVLGGEAIGQQAAGRVKHDDNMVHAEDSSEFEDAVEELRKLGQG